jgi:hypothetical protein
MALSIPEALPIDVSVRRASPTQSPSPAGAGATHARTVLPPPTDAATRSPAASIVPRPDTPAPAAPAPP